MKPKLVPCGVVAKYFSVSSTTVRRWCLEGRIKAERTPGGEWRCHVDENGKPVTAE